MLTFIEHPRFLHKIAANNCISSIITSTDIARQIEAGPGIGVSEDPRRTFWALQNALAQTGFYGLNGPTQVHSSARIHPRALIAETGVEIGPDAVVGANSVVDSGACIGRGVVVHAGAVLGGAGFQTLRRGGDYIEMAHCGGLHIGEGAIVFANATIARGIFRQATKIGAGCRIGSNAFISHNVAVGDFSFIGHGAVVNGNVSIGRESWIGPGAVVCNNITVGEGAHVSLGSVVFRNVDAGARVSGNFAVPHERLLRHISRLG
jgi:UDP-3-O-[3-hydroxymyristoyl] glucosamine N-acyltransferase